MQRGILELTPTEVSEVFKYFDITKYEGFPLEVKLTAAKESSDEIITIELSENEVEAILDSVALPTDNDTDATKSLRMKAQSLLYQFRGTDEK